MNYLIKGGTKVNVANGEGLIPLHIAIFKKTSGITELLIRAGADIDAASAKENVTPLHFAAGPFGCVQIVQLLLKAGADIHKVTHKELTPLSLAILKGHTEIQQMLIAAGADTDQALDTIIDGFEQNCARMREESEAARAEAIRGKGEKKPATTQVPIIYTGRWRTNISAVELSHNFHSARHNSFFEKELYYLLAHGYQPSADGCKMHFIE